MLYVVLDGSINLELISNQRAADCILINVYVSPMTAVSSSQTGENMHAHYKMLGTFLSKAISGCLLRWLAYV